MHTHLNHGAADAACGAKDTRGSARDGSTDCRQSIQKRSQSFHRCRARSKHNYELCCTIVSGAPSACQQRCRLNVGPDHSVRFRADSVTVRCACKSGSLLDMAMLAHAVLRPAAPAVGRDGSSGRRCPLPTGWFGASTHLASAGHCACPTQGHQSVGCGAACGAIRV